MRFLYFLVPPRMFALIFILINSEDALKRLRSALDYFLKSCLGASGDQYNIPSNLPPPTSTHPKDSLANISKEVELRRILSPISEVPGESAGVSFADDSCQFNPIQQTHRKLLLGRGLCRHTDKPCRNSALQNSEAAELHRGTDLKNSRIIQVSCSVGDGPD